MSERFLAISPECEEDPDFPGDCAVHEKRHEPGEQPEPTCEHEVVLLDRTDHVWKCRDCGQWFRMWLKPEGPTVHWTAWVSDQ